MLSLNLLLFGLEGLLGERGRGDVGGGVDGWMDGWMTN